MYSYADRLRAVELYIRLGKRFCRIIAEGNAGRAAGHRRVPAGTGPLPVRC